MAPHPQWPYEVIFVDDGSTDLSFKRMQGLYDTDPDHVRVIRLRRNFGQTAAMSAGFDAATGDVIVPMDADLQNDPADIPLLLNKIAEGYDVVSGWRADRKDPTLTRKIPSSFANFLISWLTGVHLHDYGCTIKAYHREVVGFLGFYGEMHRFLPALAHWAGANITEVKVNHRPRQHGVSKYGLGRTLTVVMDLITIKFLLSSSTKPMQVFGKWGFLSVFGGFSAGLVSLWQKMTPPYQDVTSSPWMFIAIFFTLGGIQLMSMGLLGEINIRTYYESQQRPTYTVRTRLGHETKPPARS
jgi:glycosyltransferase involved in cell wall biosynthesis